MTKARYKRKHKFEDHNLVGSLPETSRHGVLAVPKNLHVETTTRQREGGMEGGMKGGKERGDQVEGWRDRRREGKRERG